MNDFREFMRLRRELRADIVEKTRQAEKSGWDTQKVEGIKVDIQTCLILGQRLSAFLLIPAGILAILVIYLMLADPNYEGNGYAWASGIAVLVSLTSVFIFWPMVGIIRTIRLLPDDIYEDLVQPIRISLDLVNIGVSIALLLYVLVPFHIREGYPLVFLVASIWLFAPISLYVARKDALFWRTRVAQLFVLFLAASASAVSPVPLGQYQWWAQRNLAQRIRVTDNKEITDRWAELQWFTPEGKPLVWYSYRADSGYHLYATPGHDPETNEELNAVSRNEIRLKIKQELEDRQMLSKELKERQIARETLIATEKKALQVEEAKALQIEADKKREEEMRTEYVYSPYLKGAAQSSTLLVVIEEDGQENGALESRLSSKLRTLGFTSVQHILTPKFFSSEAFTDILSGSSASRFPLGDFIGKLLVIRPQTVIAHERPADAGDLIVATATLKLSLIDAGSSQLKYESEVQGRGTAYKELNAKSDALDKAEEQLSKVAAALADAQ